MFSIEKYIDGLKSYCTEAFGSRLIYIGLQGSYLRREATDESDIDIMVVIDDISAGDLDTYRGILKKVGDYDRSCGFICGRTDLLCWNPLEICQLVHTTKDYYGNLANLVPAYTRQDELNYVKLSLNNLYHELCHRYVHSTISENMPLPPQTCKSVFFIMQNLHYLESGDFILTKKELLSQLHGENKRILEMALSQHMDFKEVFPALFCWCQNTLESLSRTTQSHCQK